MRVSPITNRYYNNSLKPAFKGHWETFQRSADYPYEDTVVNVHKYVADPDETFEEIAKNFSGKSNSTEFLNHEYYGRTYTLQDNYFVDLGQNNEVKKMRLTKSAQEKFDAGEFVEAVQDKLEIAKILKRQGKEHDKFLTEEGIRRIYTLADQSARFSIEKLVSKYNPDMAADLFRHLR